jgi:hypothetical protein
MSDGVIRMVDKSGFALPTRTRQCRCCGEHPRVRFLRQADPPWQTFGRLACHCTALPYFVDDAGFRDTVAAWNLLQALVEK